MCNFFAQVSLLGAVPQGLRMQYGYTGAHPGGCSARLPCAVELLVGWSGAPVQAQLSCPPQPDALAMGKDAATLRAEGVPEHLVPHKTFTGGCGAGWLGPKGAAG